MQRKENVHALAAKHNVFRFRAVRFARAERVRRDDVIHRRIECDRVDHKNPSNQIKWFQHSMILQKKQEKRLHRQKTYADAHFILI